MACSQSGISNSSSLPDACTGVSSASSSPASQSGMSISSRVVAGGAADIGVSSSCSQSGSSSLPDCGLSPKSDSRSLRSSLVSFSSLIAASPAAPAIAPGAISRTQSGRSPAMASSSVDSAPSSPRSKRVDSSLVSPDEGSQPESCIQSGMASAPSLGVKSSLAAGTGSSSDAADSQSGRSPWEESGSSNSTPSEAAQDGFPSGAIEAAPSHFKCSIVTAWSGTSWTAGVRGDTCAS